jgi:hypothetical protein
MITYRIYGEFAACYCSFHRNLGKGYIVMTMKENLLNRFGPLMPMAGLAALLDRSPEAVRMFLRSNNSLANEINTAKLKVGRRLYFRTVEIARFLSGDEK